MEQQTTGEMYAIWAMRITFMRGGNMKDLASSFSGRLRDGTIY